MSEHLLAAMAIAFLAGLIIGLTGFGSALVSVPPLLLLYPPATVVTIVITLSLLTGWVVLLGAWHHIEIRMVGTLLPWAFAGIVTGAIVLKIVNADYIALLASTIVVLFAVVLAKGWLLPGTGSSLATALAGFASGTLNGTTGLAGPPIVLLLTARGYGVQAFRSSTIAYFLVIDAVGLLVLWQQGIAGGHEFAVSLALLPPALIGSLVGRKIVPRVSVPMFRRLTLGLVVLTGLAGVIHAVVALVG